MPAASSHTSSARSLVPGDFGVLEYAARSDASLHSAFERLARSQSLVNDRAALELRDEGETTTIRYVQPGLPPGDVAFVVISHLHGDRTGVASEFPRAVFLGGPSTRIRGIDGESSLAAGKAPDWREVGFEPSAWPIAGG